MSLRKMKTRLFLCCELLVVQSRSRQSRLLYDSTTSGAEDLPTQWTGPRKMPRQGSPELNDLMVSGFDI